MLRIGIALVLAAHGIGHLIGVVGALRPGGVTWGGSSTSWALSPFLGEGTAVVEAAVFSVATIGWVAAGVLLLAEAEVWRGVAIAAAVASLVALALYPHQLAPASMVGAIAINVIALTGLVLLDWPPPERVGA